LAAAAGPPLGQGGQGAVVEHHVGGDAVGPGPLAPPRPHTLGQGGLGPPAARGCSAGGPTARTLALGVRVIPVATARGRTRDPPGGTRSSRNREGFRGCWRPDGPARPAAP